MRASIEVADILRAAGPAYRAAYAGHLSLTQLKVMSAIEHCRNAALGGHVKVCEDCGGRMIVIEVFERWRQPRGPREATATNRESCP